MIKRSFDLLLLLFGLFLASACTMTIGGPSRLPDPPAPTAIPLSEPAVSLAGVPGRSISLPPGFEISVFADGLDDPRMMNLDSDGHIYVAERGAGRILRLTDGDSDGRADQIEIVAEGLKAPSSLAFYQDGSLYVGETNQVLRFPPLAGGETFSQPEVIVPDLPGGGHNTRAVLFSPDYSTLYVSIGSSCNVCEETDPRRAAIMRYDPDGSAGRLFAKGLRNAVGITMRPGVDELWATNNGRDFLGDDLPPETIYLVQDGKDYGWPSCHSGRIIDPDLGSETSCQGIEDPLVEMQAHTAPLGLEFYSGDQFPEEYRGDLFVGLHGSWNRSSPVGYKIVRIPLDGDTTGPVEDFAAGWLEGGSSWGRPVDVLTGPEGSLYVSDDAGGRIYRISYHGN
ncbi:MAG: sorbosone dehydrogenase family protein [Chloroflexota bacterium]|nr:MAG: sorbosone dehydrogenase family protein [Chloroflexota bacterium]